MAMTALERKAAFASAVTTKETTLHAAAATACGVTWFHLAEGIAGRRALSAEVKAKFAAYIGRAVTDVFGEAEVPESVA